jgi:DnaD/phage-associated family protein
MDKFPGFNDRTQKDIGIPDPFFRIFLPDIDDLDELKITLYVFWRLFYSEGIFRFILLSDILKDEQILKGFAGNKHKAVERLIAALEKAVNRGTFLKAILKENSKPETFFFMNNPKGQAAVKAIKNGKWVYRTDSKSYYIEPPPEIRNIFQLYEENIGPITPMLADALKDIEVAYPEIWIEEAFQIAVENNKRSLKYIEAILKRWHEGGKNGRRTEADFKKSGKEYIDGEYSDFIEH